MDDTNLTALLQSELIRRIKDELDRLDPNLADRPGPDKRDRYISTHSKTWRIEGARLRAEREMLNVNIRELARALGVSSERIKRLEQGQPVYDARLLIAAYRLYLHQAAHDPDSSLQTVRTNDAYPTNYLIN